MPNDQLLRLCLETLSSKQQWQLIEKFCALLRTYNSKVNLVSRQDVNQLIEHQVAPSMAFFIVQRLHPAEHILDIGSGGGFPGIINAILFPTSQFVLVDATKKKIVFLQSVISTLGLSNTTAIWSRVEKLAHNPDYQQRFDHTTSRAVAPLNRLWRWSQPLLKPHGTVEALKGGDISQELDAVNAVSKCYHLPTTWQVTEQLQQLVLVSLYDHATSLVQ